VADAVARRLTDESDLRDLIHRYAFGLDTRDWTMWRSVFTDEVLIDMSDYEGEAPTKPVPIDLHVQYVRRLFAGFAATQHFIGTHRFDIDGDRATIVAHMRAEHWVDTNQGGDRYTMYGTYTDQCVRTADGWRITEVKLTLLREEGNRHVMRVAARRGKEAVDKRD
jgi:3-phenylpropionate/cinnamic acid dioxygenase small subunit